MGHKLPSLDGEDLGTEEQHEIPLELLLLDAGAALGMVQLHGLGRACLIANAVLSGEPVLGESFVADILLCIEAAKQHAHHDNEDTRVSLIASLDVVETWGLEPKRRLQNAVREVVASLETIRQITTNEPHEPISVGSRSKQARDRLMTINNIAQRSLGALGFREYEPDRFADDEDEDDDDDSNDE